MANTIVKPTKEQIEVEIATLKGYAPQIIQYSAFGDSNREKIEGQIVIAERDLSEEEIYEKYAEEDPEDDSEPQNWELIADLLDMRAWLDGETESLPSAGWEALIPGFQSES